MNVKELLTNKALMDSIVEDIDEVPEDSEVMYCVWALGYDSEDDLTDDEFLLGEFEDPDEAVEFAENFNLEAFNAEYEKCQSATAYLSIEVETVVDDPENDGTMNIGTVYSKELQLYDDVETGLGDYNNVVCLTKKDFELLDDGTLKVSCSLLRDFNKNDIILVEFADEPESSPLEYKIMSKVIYSDGDYYHCELLI